MHRAPIVLFFVFLVLAGVLQAQSGKDATATALLVGTWVVPKDQESAVLKRGETTFKADGTFTSFADLRINGKKVRIDVEGKWKVEKGVVIEKITKSSNEQMAPLGLITRDTILELSDKMYWYRSESGQERKNVRKAAK